jgi:2-dehydropantoate 2-reductase
MLRILILGAGAIGCFVGGSLAASGQQVTLVGRRALMRKIAADGLKLRWPNHAPQIVSTQTATSLAELSPPFDFILLTVKGPALSSTIEQLAAHTPLLAKAHLVSLQNGIGSEEQLAAALGPEKIIAGTITLPINIPTLGTVEVSKAKGGLGLAPLRPTQPVNQLAVALNQAGLATNTYDDYRAMKWSKLLLNIVTNASCAILNQSPAQVIACPALFNLEIKSLHEAISVMKAQDMRAVNLPGYRVNWLYWLISARWLPLALTRAILRPYMLEGRGTKMPSLQIDLAAGRSVSEISTLNGAIVEAGKQAGVATPVNQTLSTILAGLFSGKLDWADYQNQPDNLLEAVAKYRAAS